MAKYRTLDLSDLRRMSVLDTATGDKVGTVLDAVVHPTEGTLAGLMVSDVHGQPFVLGLDAFSIGPNAVMMPAGARREVPDTSEVMQRGVPAGKRVVGANLVTEDGRRIGEVRELILLVEKGWTILRVGGNLIQKLFGGGYYLRGDLPSAFATDGARLIVPSNTEEAHAFGKVDDLIAKAGID
jgi:sporulation protein YlmC with PRC-barrel domain